MKVRHTVATLLTFATIVLAPAPLEAQGPIDQAAWLSGCWEARTATRSTLEMWMPPSGGLMMGAGRTVVNGITREFEHLRIRARGDTLVYTAIPSGQRETDFAATHASADSLIFENLAHDFPQRIIYRKRGADSVVARAEGPGANGAVRGFNIPMRRVECVAPAP
jgi:hypothetical protein